MSCLRLIVKVPNNVQTSPDSWVDTTTFRTWKVTCPDDLWELLTKQDWAAVIIGAEPME